MAQPGTEAFTVSAAAMATDEQAVVTDDRRVAQSDTRKTSSRLLSLYREQATGLAAWLRSRFGNGPPDPEDVTQLAFQKLAERKDLDDIDNLKAYVWRTAHNLMLKEIRSQGVRDRNDFEVERIYFAQKGDDLGPERVLEAEQQIQLINRCLLEMPEKRRRAFMLHRVDGLNVAAVARELKLSRPAAAKHVARASADLDALLVKHTEPETNG
ncbi:MAG: sigma-70 family RNA polymerase sigma factor [Pseudomonadota bacterium]